MAEIFKGIKCLNIKVQSKNISDEVTELADYKYRDKYVNATCISL
jgi:hypothetical protein